MMKKTLVLFCFFVCNLFLSAQQNEATVRIQITFQPDTGFNQLPSHVYLADDDSGRIIFIGKTGLLDTVIPYTPYMRVIAWADGFKLHQETLYPKKGAAAFTDTINLIAGTADRVAVGFNTTGPGGDNSRVYRYLLDYVNAHPAAKCNIMWQCDAMQEEDKILIAESRQFMEAELPQVKKLGVDEKRVSFSSVRKFESFGCGMALQGKPEAELKQRYYGILFTAHPPATKQRGRKP